MRRKLNPGRKITVYDNWDDPDIFKKVGVRTVMENERGTKYVLAYGSAWTIKLDDGVWVLNYRL